MTGSPGTGLSGSTEVVLLTTMDEISMKHQLQIKKQEWHHLACAGTRHGAQWQPDVHDPDLAL